MNQRETVKVVHLNKKFGQKVAVHDISFSIAEGEIVGLLGQNGAGKTTTIYMILGLLKPTSGTIHVFGKELEKHRHEIASSVNFSAAYASLPGKMKVWENLYTFARLYSVKNYKNTVEQLLDEFMLMKLRNLFMKDLSSGQRARVYLAKAFVNSPKLLLLDEPTAFMDPDIADTLRKLITKKVRENQTSVIFTSHNMPEVSQLCDRVIFLHHGKIIAEDTPEALAKKMGVSRIHLMVSHGKDTVISWCKKQRIPTLLEGRYVQLEVEEKNIAMVLSRLAEENVVYDEISIDKPTLEDFFIEITRKPIV